MPCQMTPALDAVILTLGACALVALCAFILPCL